MWQADYILVCEVMHWLVSLCLASAVFSLIYLIYGEGVTSRRRWLGSLSAAFASCFSMHYLLDAAQWGW